MQTMQSSEIVSILPVLKNQSVAVSKVLMKHADALSPDSVSRWKDELVDVAKGTARLYKKHDLVSTFIRRSKDPPRLPSECSEDPHRFDQIEDLNMRAAEHIKDIEKCTDMHIQGNVNNNEHVRDIQMKLKIAGVKRVRDRDDDDDIEIEETEATENSFKCPFSTLLFEKPMKNANCVHRLDKRSLDALLKGCPRKLCPVGGCGKYWSKDSASEDKELLVEMRRFQRNVAPSQQETARVNMNAVELDEGDDDEDGYQVVGN